LSERRTIEGLKSVERVLTGINSTWKEQAERFMDLVETYHLKK
jgi:hypothetical protein